MADETKLDTAISRLEGMLNSIDPRYHNDPRYIDAKNRLDELKALRDGPITGEVVDIALAVEAELDDIAVSLPSVANATLDVVRGLGGAIIDGLDGAYDAARAKLSGKEADVVAGLVVATLIIMTAVYLYHSAKYARDAF